MQLRCFFVQQIHLCFTCYRVREFMWYPCCQEMVIANERWLYIAKALSNEQKPMVV